MGTFSRLAQRLFGGAGTEKRFHSQFGGLWTDRIGATREAERRHESGALTREDLQDLLFFINEGYLILPGAVDADLARQVIEDVEASVQHGDRFMTYWDTDGHHKEPGSPGKLFKPEAKVIDVHATIASVQQAIFSERIQRFLGHLFEMPSVAFQTLYFHRGSEQGFHQDTAFVYVNKPLHFAASWIALEDIEEGSGELQYFPGSHRLPDEIFPVSGTKALLQSDPSTRQYSANLQRKCEEAGLEMKQFRPRKGDVLIWAADLVHGGAGIHTDSTRRSLVTHYCPEDTQPPYAASLKSGRSAVRGNWIMSES